MRKYTEIRQAVADTVKASGVCGYPVKVLIGPHKRFGDEDLILALRALMVNEEGVPLDDKDAEAELDRLMEDIPEVLDADKRLGGLVGDAVVTACAGHRIFGGAPGERPIIGTEWTIKVMTD